MASHRISGQPWADGTTVTVYPGAAQPALSDGVPAGAAVTSAVVTGGSVVFSGLATDVRYVAYAAGVSRRFLVPQQDPMDARSLRTRVDEIEGELGPSASSRLDSMDARVVPLESHVVSAGALGASYTPDLAGHLDTLVVGTLSANLTVAAPTNAVPGATLVFDFTQDAGARSVTWFSASQPAGSLAVDTALGSRTVVSFYTPDGVTWVGWSTELGVIDVVRSKRYFAELAGAVTATLQSAVSGTGASVAQEASSQAPNDVRGSYDVTVRSSPAPVAGAVLVVAFTSSYLAVDGSAKRPSVLLTPRSAAAAAADLYVTPLAGQFTVSCRNAPAASDVLAFSYWVVG